MQVRAGRLAGLVVTLAAGMLVAAPGAAMPLDVHTPPQPERVVPPGAPELIPPRPQAPPGAQESCVIPARAAAPVDPCQPPGSCIRPAIHRGPPATACLPGPARPAQPGGPGAPLVPRGGPWQPVPPPSGVPGR